MTDLHTYSPMAAVRQWHQAVGEKPYAERDAQGRDQLVLLRTTLIAEEVKEVEEALMQYRISGIFDEMLGGEPMADVEAIAKELADLLYVVYGTADLLGIPLEEVFEEVHRSNMTKVRPDGTVKRRADGKILKPETYEPADIRKILSARQT